jgi:hypothetical protein
MLGPKLHAFANFHLHLILRLEIEMIAQLLPSD